MTNCHRVILNIIKKRAHGTSDDITNSEDIEEVARGASDDVNNSEENMIAENDNIFDTPKKQTESFQYKTPDHNEMS